MSFTQSPSLSNNPKILNNYLIFTVKCCNNTIAVSRVTNRKCIVSLFRSATKLCRTEIQADIEERLRQMEKMVQVTKQTKKIREVVKKSKWKFKMAFAIRGPTPPLMAKFPDIFLPHFFSFAIESYIYETDFTLQKYHF